MLVTVPSGTLICRFAASPEDILAVQRLRYTVFVTECGASGKHIDHDACREQDNFDAFADHLLLIDTARPADDQIIGTYRLMTTTQAAKAGGFYSATEFDLTALTALDVNILELGRSCLHADYRGGTALLQLWQAIGQYVADHDIDILFGVASFQGVDIPSISGPLQLLHDAHLAPPELRARAHGPSAIDVGALRSEPLDQRAAMLQMPQLIKAYLRLGGVVGQGAYVDHAFNTTDVCMILQASKMTARQRALYGGIARNGE